jgi:hypothetical protein
MLNCRVLDGRDLIGGCRGTLEGHGNLPLVAAYCTLTRMSYDGNPVKRTA